MHLICLAAFLSNTLCFSLSHWTCFFSFFFSPGFTLLLNIVVLLFWALPPIPFSPVLQIHGWSQSLKKIPEFIFPALACLLCFKLFNSLSTSPHLVLYFKLHIFKLKLLIVSPGPKSNSPLSSISVKDNHFNLSSIPVFLSGSNSVQQLVL